VAGVLAVAAAAVGALAGRGGSAEAVPLRSSAANAGLAMSFPDRWSQSPSTPEIPGIAFQDPISLATSTGEDAAVAGFIEGSGRSLLPPSFLARLDREPATTDRVKLGALKAYRFRDLRPRGLARGLTLFVAPTSVGVASVACIGEDSGDCERMAGSLRLLKGRALPLGPSAGYAKTLAAEVRRLDSRRTAARRDLAAASTPAGQASAADRLSSAFKDAADRLARATPGPADKAVNTAIVSALRVGRTAYAAMAEAARASDAAGFAAAGADARSAESRLRAALRRLKDLGYRLK
jgi:hypothetical protein